MLVLAAVPTDQCHKLRRAGAPRFPVVHARNWDDALATIRTRPVELAAVDPQLEGSPSAREIERLRVLFPSLPLILYTALTPATAAVLLALGHSGINAVVFTRIDDHPARLREVLAHEEARSASRQLLDQLAAVLAPLPSELRWVVEEVLRAPAELQTVQQVAARARVDRRTFERWSSRRLGSCMPTGCCRIRVSRSTTSPNASATPRPRRCSCTPAPIWDSPPARCGSPSSPARPSSASLRDSPRCPRRTPRRHERHAASTVVCFAILHHPHRGGRRRATTRIGARAGPPGLPRAGRRLGRDGIRAARLRARRCRAARRPAADHVGTGALPRPHSPPPRARRAHRHHERRRRGGQRARMAPEQPLYRPQ